MRRTLIYSFMCLLCCVAVGCMTNRDVVNGTCESTLSSHSVSLNLFCLIPLRFEALHFSPLFTPAPVFPFCSPLLFLFLTAELPPRPFLCNNKPSRLLRSMDFRGCFGSVWTPAPGGTIIWRVRTGQCLDRLAPHVHRRVNGHAATLRHQASMALSLSLLHAHTRTDAGRHTQGKICHSK